jgi:hypothetical protein
MKIDIKELDARVGRIARREREAAAELLRLINEATAHKAWVELGFASAFDWLTKGHGYAEGAAYRRLAAARLLADAPELAPKIASGEATVSALAAAQTAIRREERRTGTRIATESRRALAAQVVGKSSLETQRALVEALPNSAQAHDSLRATGLGSSRLAVEISKEGHALIVRARELLSHAMPGASLGEIVERLAREFVSRREGKAASAATARPPSGRRAKKVPQASGQAAYSAAPPAAVYGQAANSAEPPVAAAGAPAGGLASAQGQLTQHLPASVFARRNSDGLSAGISAGGPARVSVGVSAADRRATLARAGFACEWVNRETGRRCGSRMFIEVDHLRPRALGGGNELSNLRCLCRAHNALAARRLLGSGPVARAIARERPRRNLNI